MILLQAYKSYDQSMICWVRSLNNLLRWWTLKIKFKEKDRFWIKIRYVVTTLCYLVPERGLAKTPPPVILLNLWWSFFYLLSTFALELFNKEIKYCLYTLLDFRTFYCYTVLEIKNLNLLVWIKFFNLLYLYI